MAVRAVDQGGRSAVPELILIKIRNLILIKENAPPDETRKETHAANCDKKVACNEISFHNRAFDFGQLYFGLDGLTST
jgi:hypothetical protein